ncbi:hypothetical protein Tco_0593523, partial [Tanacetum coccineum]
AWKRNSQDLCGKHMDTFVKSTRLLCRVTKFSSERCTAVFTASSIDITRSYLGQGFKVLHLYLDYRIASIISKMGFVFLEQGFSTLSVHVCISISICCSATGFVYQKSCKIADTMMDSAAKKQALSATSGVATRIVSERLALGRQNAAMEWRANLLNRKEYADKWAKELEQRADALQQANALRRRAEALGQRANKLLQKHFEDLVIGCFCDNARGILTTCKAYTKGVQVGCAIDSGEEVGSRWFKSNVEG